MKVSFQADADLNENIVRGVVRREPQIDFQTATAAGLPGLSDLDVLTMAASAGRILVSHDRKTNATRIRKVCPCAAEPRTPDCLPENRACTSD